MAVDRERIARAVVEILAAVGEDPSREDLRETPSRVADAYEELFAGVGIDPQTLLAETMPLEPTPAGSQSDAVIVTNIALRSVCEHHLLPFVGQAHVAYLPDAALIGLGRISRVVETLAARPQFQERLGEQIASALDEALSPRGVLVVLDSAHQCVTARGVGQMSSRTITVASRGELSELAARSEIMGLMHGGSDG
ncbi:MAG: GTP cyclohydrolase I [Aurantimicrobium sp.]|nr:GTP cyclohydrolase I [Aurantimicrobium sp.]